MRRRTIFLAAVGALIVALGAGALGADSAGTFSSPVASVASSASSAGQASTQSASSAGQASAQASLPALAASVINALVGGSEPSTVVAQSDQASAAASQASNASHESDATNPSANDSAPGLSHGQALGQSGTSGTRPGWGCGDENHVHTGPPGGPSSTPPGCAKSH